MYNPKMCFICKHHIIVFLYILFRYLGCGAWAGKLFCIVMIINFLLWHLLELLQVPSSILTSSPFWFRLFLFLSKKIVSIKQTSYTFSQPSENIEEVPDTLLVQHRHEEVQRNFNEAREQSWFLRKRPISVVNS